MSPWKTVPWTYVPWTNVSWTNISWTKVSLENCPMHNLIIAITAEINHPIFHLPETIREALKTTTTTTTTIRFILTNSDGKNSSQLPMLTVKCAQYR